MDPRTIHKTSAVGPSWSVLDRALASERGSQPASERPWNLLEGARWRAAFDNNRAVTQLLWEDLASRMTQDGVQRTLLNKFLRIYTKLR
ncbi:hypothetical protein D3C85_1087020 [compost metagenome]